MERAALDADRVDRALSARWASVRVVDSTASTNADLVADPSAPDRTLLVAEQQVAGRGRLERSWQSPPRAGLTFSVLVRPSVGLQHWGWLPLLTGVAVAETLRSHVAATLKWPNDVLIDGAKVAGILVQTAEGAAVIGVGVNVSTTRDELPVPTATSLALAGADLDRTALLIDLATALDSRIAQWQDVGGDAGACGLHDAYRSVCSTLGSTVRVTLTGDDAMVGDAVDVDGFGRLVLALAGGERRAVSAGDVEHLRPS